MAQAKLIAYISAALGLFLAGWLANGWRLNGQIADMKLEASQTALEAVQKMKSQNDQLNKKVSEIDAQKTKELNNAKAEINRMRSKLDNGTGWLQFNARCPSVPGPSADSSMGNATAPRLDAAAQSAYFVLREGITLCRKQVEFFQETAKAQQAQRSKE